jgi:glycerol uptake facilitator-like aquaporin
MIMQVAGAVLGVWLAHAMFGLEIMQVSAHVRDGMGLWIAEAVATFGLILTIMGTLKHRPDFVPSAVGLYITSAYWFTASTSFANPAVTLARSLTDTFCGIAPSSVGPFVAAQIAGALLGLLVAAGLGLSSFNEANS